MSSALLCAVVVLACASTFSAAQLSCKGRCGAEYYRGYMCQCDYDCLSYGECCRDYESKCTTKNSCKGRCGEVFKRGRLCSCDSDCLKYNQCCSDYKSHCDAKEPALNKGLEPPSPFSEGNNADDPLVSPTSYPEDDLSNDELDHIFPSDPTPESTSGYGPTAELLDQVPADPSAELSTGAVTTSSQTETTPAKNHDHSPSTPSETSDASDSIRPTSPGVTSAPLVSILPSLTSALQTGPPASTGASELEASGQVPVDDGVPETPETNPSPEPQVTTSPSSVSSLPEELTQKYTTSATSLATTTFASPTADPTASPMSSSSKPEPDAAEDSEDASTGPDLSTSGDSLTTHASHPTVAAQHDSNDDVTPQAPTADLGTSPVPQTTPMPQIPDTQRPSPTKPTVAEPTTKPGSKPLDTDDPRGYQGDDSNDTNLCSGRPVSAVTTLRNGTIAVFRGHYFWFLDGNRVPGPAQGITQVWGVPSPVDTVFTRCSCQGKTYILKGAQYWRFENNVLDPGYPKVIETGFDGLRGHITAALSVPQYRSRRESVYFFKRGGSVQKYSYQSGTSPTCGKKVKYGIYTVRSRTARQAGTPVSVLEAPINIHTTWRGFPSTITAAVSVPNNREPEGYKYYVFSRSKSYNVRMDGERPVIAASNANRSPQSKDFFKCPKKV